MAQQAAKKKEVCLGDDIGDVSINANRSTVEIHADGSMTVHYTAGGMREISASHSAPRIGEKIQDGTTYAGVSPYAKTPMFAMPADALQRMTFNDAAAYAKQLNQEKYLGHDDWRVPTKAELNVLFNNRATIGGFNISGSSPEGWYWSAISHGGWSAWGQRFSDGWQYHNVEDIPSSVRLVRTGP